MQNIASICGNRETEQMTPASILDPAGMPRHGLSLQGGQGMRAVHTKGTGKLTGVRVINFGEDSLYW